MLPTNVGPARSRRPAAVARATGSVGQSDGSEERDGEGDRAFAVDHARQDRTERETPMTIERWDPFREAVSLRDAMNSLLQESFVRPTNFLSQDGPAALPVDVSETENEYVIKASLPGV